MYVVSYEQRAGVPSIMQDAATAPSPKANTCFVWFTVIQIYWENKPDHDRDWVLTWVCHRKIRVLTGYFLLLSALNMLPSLDKIWRTIEAGGQTQGSTCSMSSMVRRSPAARRRLTVLFGLIQSRDAKRLRWYDRSSAGARSHFAAPAKPLAAFHFSSASLKRPPKLVVGRRLVGIQRHGSLQQYYGLFRLLQPEFGFAQIEVGRPEVGL